MPVPDHTALLALAATQHGLVTDDQAHKAGYTIRMVRRRVATGVWERLLPGVLRFPGPPTSGRQAATAAALWGGPEALVSHSTAAVLWGLDGVETSRVAITVPGSIHPRHPAVVIHRATELLPADRDRIDAIPVTSALRTLVDVANELPSDALELAVEDAMRRGLVTRGQLRWRIEQFGQRGRRGTSKLSRLLDERANDRASDSAAEVRLQRFLVRSGLPRPRRQHPVTHDGTTIHVDLAYPELRIAIEFDSVRWHSGRSRIDRDAQRKNLLRAAGWDTVHVTHTMMRDTPDVVARAVRDAITDATAHEREKTTSERSDSPARPARRRGSA